MQVDPNYVIIKEGVTDELIRKLRNHTRRLRRQRNGIMPSDLKLVLLKNRPEEREDSSISRDPDTYSTGTKPIAGPSDSTTEQQRKARAAEAISDELIKAKAAIEVATGKAIHTLNEAVTEATDRLTLAASSKAQEAVEHQIELLRENLNASVSSRNLKTSTKASGLKSNEVPEVPSDTTDSDEEQKTTISASTKASGLESNGFSEVPSDIMDSDEEWETISSAPPSLENRIEKSSRASNLAPDRPTSGSLQETFKRMHENLFNPILGIDLGDQHFIGPRQGEGAYTSLSILDPLITIELLGDEFRVSARFNIETTILSYDIRQRLNI